MPSESLLSHEDWDKLYVQIARFICDAKDWPGSWENLHSNEKDEYLKLARKLLTELNADGWHLYQLLDD